jgi:hypothetical protein
MKRSPLGLFGLLVLSLLVTACATMRATVPPAPETPRQALLAVETEYAALIRTATDMQQAGMFGVGFFARVSRDKVDAAFQEVNKALSAAWLAYGAGDLTTMEGQLGAARAGILLARQLLTPKGDA